MPSQDSGDGHEPGDEHGAGHGHGLHAHGQAGAPNSWWAHARRWLTEVLHGLYHGMIEAPASENIEKAAEDAEDAFLFACFADAFGVPSPVSYYTVELLPYMAEEFEQWERRMWDRGSLLERKGEQYHVH